MSRLTLVKNAFANVCRGGASGLVMLLLPPFLTKSLDKDAYNTWLLILQLSAYVSFLDFGIQTAVGRYIAHHNELGETTKRDSIISNAIAILTCLGLLAMIGISFLSWYLPTMFGNMPISLQKDSQFALLLIGSSLATSLPFSVFGGIFIGIQRYDIPAWIIGIGKLIGAFFLVIVAHATHNIVLMSIVMSIANLSTGLWQLLAYKKLLHGYNISLKHISRKTSLEILKSCIALSISSFTMLLISGLDTTIIGVFDYKSIIYYSLSVTVTSFLFGSINSMLSTIIPVAAVAGTKNDPEELGKLLVSASRWTFIMLIITVFPSLIISRWLLTVWVGEIYANDTYQLLNLLIIGISIRVMGAPFFMIAVGCGERRILILSPLIESISNLFISIILTSKIGVNGVAFGTLFGALIGLGTHFFYGLKNSSKIHIPNKKIMFTSIFRPSIAIAPTLGVMLLIVSTNTSLPDNIYIPIISLSIIASFFTLWKYGFVNEDRYLVVSTFRKILQSRG
jgi:O-antigen/teichoic acid export membrane protein